MSWANLDPTIRTIAEHELTPKQIAVFKLHLAGCGARRMSTMLGIQRSTVRDHLKSAHDRLHAAGVTHHDDGTYTTERQAA